MERSGIPVRFILLLGLHIFRSLGKAIKRVQNQAAICVIPKAEIDNALQMSGAFVLEH
jgi:hypothetical protein